MAEFKHKSTDKAVMSDDDLELMKLYTEAYNNAADDAGRSAAHNAAERLRAKYGYSGGADGSGYIKTGQAGQVLGATGETYGGNGGGYQYDANGSLAALRERIMNRTPFSYDAESDPLYLSLREQYARNGKSAMKDTLGQISARTGGLASSYAGSASQQAYDRYMSELSGKIPELQQLAYSMYLKDLDADYETLGMLTDAENAAYNRYLDDREYEYQLGRDAIEDAHFADELDYKRQTAAQKLAQKGSKSGDGTKESKPDITYAQIFSAIKRANEGGMPLTTKEKEAYEYWIGEPWSGEEESAQTGVDDVTYRGVRDTVIMMMRAGDKEGAAKKIREIADRLSDSQWADIQKYLEG